MVEAFLHQRGDHAGHIGGVHADPVRLVVSAVLNTESKTHAGNKQLFVCPVAQEKRSTQKKQNLYEHGNRQGRLPQPDRNEAIQDRTAEYSPEKNRHCQQSVQSKIPISARRTDRRQNTVARQVSRECASEQITRCVSITADKSEPD